MTVVYFQSQTKNRSSVKQYMSSIFHKISNRMSSFRLIFNRPRLSTYRYFANATTTSTQAEVVKPPEPGTTSTTTTKIPQVNTGTFLSSAKTERTLPDLKKQSISFDEVPGPAALRLIANIWTGLPMMAGEITVRFVQYLLKSSASALKMLGYGEKTHVFNRMFQTYGPIVRLHGPLGTDVVLLSKAEDASRAFLDEGIGVRCCLDSMEMYRLNNQKFKSSGPYFSNQNLEALRQTVAGKTVSISMTQQIKHMDEVCNEFVVRITNSRSKQEELTTNLKMELYKCSLDCLSMLCFNKKMGFMDTLNPISETGRIMEGLIGATEAVRKCEYGVHLWRFFETPAFRSLSKNCELIDSVLYKEIDKSMNSLREKKEKNSPLTDLSLVESLLLKPDITEDDVRTMMLDLFLVGCNSICHTVCYLLYHLARNPRCQIKLHEEIVKQKDTFDEFTTRKVPYANACIKECLRLDPPVPIINRKLVKDTIINHYRIPKNTTVLFASHLNSGLEEYYEEPNRFMPERWLGDKVGSYGHELLTFTSLPFGVGPKATKIREMANIQMTMLLMKLLRKFRIEYNYGDAKNVNEFLSSPTKPMRFRFVDRNH